VSVFKHLCGIPLTQSHYSLQNPAEIMNPYTQNYSCVPYTSKSRPCSMGNYASYSINVLRADDAIAGIKFALQHNVRLVIKNTGHEYVYHIIYHLSERKAKTVQVS
jgi:hypothetical protein